MFGVVNPASAAGAAPETAPADGAPAAPMEPGLVLLVDDDPEQRELMRRHITNLGHETLDAEHGAGALQMLEKGRTPDVILLDIQMPVMGGFETLAALKNHAVWRDIPVIMLSALDDIGRAVRCIQMGAEDYLHKPCNAVLLNARIAGALTRRRLRDKEVAFVGAMADLSTAAAAMALGVYEPSMLDAVAGRSDAVGHLARVFQSMAREVQARHDALQADRTRATS
jgi:CheY-like chemotaxis protein